MSVVSPVWETGDKVDWKDYVQPVEFDIAVTTTGKASATGKGGIKVLAIVEAGAEGSTSREHSTVNRIKFTVSIVPPLKPTYRHPETPKEGKP